MIESGRRRDLAVGKLDVKCFFRCHQTHEKHLGKAVVINYLSWMAEMGVLAWLVPDLPKEAHGGFSPHQKIH